jgi:hypothetical protein
MSSPEFEAFVECCRRGFVAQILEGLEVNIPAPTQDDEETRSTRSYFRKVARILVDVQRGGFLDLAEIERLLQGCSFGVHWCLLTVMKPLQGTYRL